MLPVTSAKPCFKMMELPIGSTDELGDPMIVAFANYGKSMKFKKTGSAICRLGSFISVFFR